MKTSAPPSRCHRRPTAEAPCLYTDYCVVASFHPLSVIQGPSLHSVASRASWDLYEKLDSNIGATTYQILI